MRACLCAAALAFLPGVATADAGDAPDRAAIEDRNPNPSYMSSRKLVTLNKADQNVVRLGPGDSYAVIEVAERGSKYDVLAKRGEEDVVATRRC